MDKINDFTKKLMDIVNDHKDSFFKGAYNIREDGQCVGRVSSENIVIKAKEGRPGIDVTIKPGTTGETVYIPTCVTKGGIDDLVYNDFYIGEDCDIKIISGCGVHTEDDSMAKHNGVHFFHVGANAHVMYEEKHIGTGGGHGTKSINPNTKVELEPNSYLEINSTQISGVDTAIRSTKALVKEGAKFIVHERLFTEDEQTSKSHFTVEMVGDNSHADVVSRSVAKDHSYQSMDSVIIGNAVCTGHSECDSIIDGDAIVDASPRLFARNKEASLIHEAAIGKIAGEQILKLRTLGLTEEEAENEIIQGFLS